ncbi:PilZ domain-containing protein [Pseudomarimonas arenosa]|uniref:PilZ domain-containing protein n=1 Tax=Pseudomarimonas arenosa TaxID=2774145 RepID=A0AAW3ZHW3_9GAMM|nr:PilZ domain-containing protein [Pseudomarimonas arenosa]MBD8524530.1 PilZ domain-containing protein [Pseudomarimonas arenosa]
MTQVSTEPESSLSLRALRLRPGMFLQMHIGNQQVVEAKFCAAIENKGVMLVPLDKSAPPSGWVENVKVDISGFTGQHDFRFPARVLGNFSIPFAYLLVSYPEQVSARKVRSALRIPTALAAKAWSGNSPKQDAQVIDLSAAGAMIEMSGNGIAVGGELQLNFEIEFERKVYTLQLAGRVCHASGAEAQHRFGLAFDNVAKADRLLLQAYTLAATQSHAVID